MSAMLLAALQGTFRGSGNGISVGSRFAVPGTSDTFKFKPFSAAC